MNAHSSGSNAPAKENSVLAGLLNVLAFPCVGFLSSRLPAKRLFAAAPA